MLAQLFSKKLQSEALVIEVEIRDSNVQVFSSIGVCIFVKDPFVFLHGQFLIEGVIEDKFGAKGSSTACKVYQNLGTVLTFCNLKVA